MSWWTRLLRRDIRERALDKELQFHVKERILDLQKSGLTEQEARRAVRLEFGGLDQVKEHCRDVRRFHRIDSLLQDVRYALRTMRKNSGFVFTAVCTLALGIGANTAIFSLISGVLLRPLPFSQPHRLVQVNETDPRNGVGPLSHVDRWRRQSTSFEGMVGYGVVSKDLQGTGNPERIPAVRAERALFQLLGVEAVAGRVFRQDDPAGVVVISSGFWKRHFGGDPSCVGRKITLDGEPFVVIGVMPEQFQFPYRTTSTELWIPWTIPVPQGGRVDVIARLKQGTDLNAARRELDTITARVLDQSADSNKGRGAVITPLEEVVVGKVRPALLTLLGAVGVVLLIACVNVMNLLLARAAGRADEIALRAALGASRARIVQQLLTESLLISAAGGAAGLLIALLTKDLLLKLVSAHIPRSWEIAFDWRVFVFLLVIGMGSGILFGFVPALSASRLDLQKGLAGGRSLGYGAMGWMGHRLRNGLIVAEIAMAFILVAGAGLLMEAFLRLQNTPVGFVSDKVLTLHLSVPPTASGNPSSYGRYLQALESQVARIAGVQSAGFIQFLPLQNWGWIGFFSVAGTAPTPVGQEQRAELRFVSPGYFEALGIPIQRGRPFDVHDTSDSQRVILINEALARRYFPNQDPIGQRTDRGTIIGVVGDVRQSGLEHPAAPEIYYSFFQNVATTSDAGVSLVVRARMQPEAVVADIRKAIHQVNPDQAVFKVKTMDQVIIDSLGNLNLYVWLIGLFAVLALLLAVAGIYGVVSYTVSGRSQEFAIRMALGARRSQIVGLVLRQGSILIAIGLAWGTGGALMLTRTLKSVTSVVSSLDPVTLLAVATLIAAVSLSACLAPARRAMRVDPNASLRYE